MNEIHNDGTVAEMRSFEFDEVSPLHVKWSRSRKPGVDFYFFDFKS